MPSYEDEVAHAQRQSVHSAYLGYLVISTLMTVWKMNIIVMRRRHVAGTSADVESVGVDLQDYANR